MSDDSWAKVIKAAGQIAAWSASLNEGTGQPGVIAPGGRGAPSAMADPAGNPGEPTQYQSLAVLAVIVMQFSRESGRPIAEIFDALVSGVDTPEDQDRQFQAAHEATRTAAKRYGNDVQELLPQQREAFAANARTSHSSWLKIIAGVRELLSYPPVQGEVSDRPDAKASGGRETLPVVRDLLRNPDALAQYQSLAMLAALVSWFSAECGRQQTEALEELSNSFTSRNAANSHSRPVEGK